MNLILAILEEYFDTNEIKSITCRITHDWDYNYSRILGSLLSASKVMAKVNIFEITNYVFNNRSDCSWDEENVELKVANDRSIKYLSVGKGTPNHYIFKIDETDPRVLLITITSNHGRFSPSMLKHLFVLYLQGTINLFSIDE